MMPAEQSWHVYCMQPIHFLTDILVKQAVPMLARKKATQYVQHCLHIAHIARSTMSTLCTQCMCITQYIHTVDAMLVRLEFHLVENAHC
jgi:hypothetical protein